MYGNRRETHVFKDDSNQQVINIKCSYIGTTLETENFKEKQIFHSSHLPKMGVMQYSVRHVLTR